MNEYSPWDLDIPELGHLEGLGKATMDWMTGWASRAMEPLLSVGLASAQILSTTSMPSVT